MFKIIQKYVLAVVLVAALQPSEISCAGNKSGSAWTSYMKAGGLVVAAGVVAAIGYYCFRAFSAWMGDNNLHNVSQSGNSGAVKCLTGNKVVSIEKKNSSGFTTPMVERGAELDIQDNEGKTVLIFVAGCGSLDTVKDLVEKGATLDIQDNEGKTALMWAARCGNLDIVIYLVDNGAKLNIRDNAGKTVLMYAIDNRNLDIVRYLVEKGATLDIKDNRGETALIKAINWQQNDTFVYLIQQGADVFIADKAVKLTEENIWVKKQLNCVKDLYRLIGQDVQENAFKDFIEKYSDSPLTIIRYLNLVSREFADKIYNWLKDERKFLGHKAWAEGKQWMYFDLYKRTSKRSPQKMFWLAQTLEGLKYVYKGNLLELKNTVNQEFNAPENLSLKQDYDKFVKKQLSKQLVDACESAKEKPFSPNKLKDLKINFNHHRWV